jgi:hypothetical protein
LAKPGHGFIGPSYLAGLEQGPDFGYAEAGQGLPQAVGALLGGLKLFGLKQVAPGAFEVVIRQVAFAALHKCPGEPKEEIADTTAPLGGRLSQQALGFFESPVFQGVLSLPQNQPRET